MADSSTGTAPTTAGTTRGSNQNPPLVQTVWLGSNAKSKARDKSDMTSIGKSIKKEERAKLPSKDLLKVQQSCEEGLEGKFAMLKLSDQSENSLKGVYDVDKRLTELQKALLDCDMDDVFTIASEMIFSDSEQQYIPSKTATTINLFTDFNKVDIETVKKYNSFIMHYGAEYSVQNLKWGAEKILKSCDPDLRSKVSESVFKLPVDQQGSIVSFLIMINHVISTSNASLRSIVTRMSNLRVSSFDGEDVSKAVSFFRSGRTVLKNNDFEPKDMADLIFNCFKTSSTPDFNAIVSTMANNQMLGVKMIPEGVGDMSSILASSDDELDACLHFLEMFYMRLLSKGAWEAKSTTKNQESTFNVSTSNDSSNVKCFNCGGPHPYTKCHLPINEEHVKAEKKAFYDAKRNQSNDTKSGTSTSSKSNNRDPATIPPKEGMCHSKVLNKGKGPLVHWCGVCSRWGDHLTQYHPSSTTTTSTSTSGHTGTQTAGNVATPPTATTSSDDASVATNPQQDGSHVHDFGGFIRNSLDGPNF